jgi:hypothetical protein
MKKSKERSKERRASAKKWADKQGVFERSTITLPDGVSGFRFEKKGWKNLDIIEYKVGEGNPDAKKGEKFFCRTFWVHSPIGPDNKAYVCSKKTFNKKCAVCDHRAELAQDPDNDPDVVKALKPKQRELFAVIDPDDKDKGVQVFEVQNYYFGKQLKEAFEAAESDGIDFEKFANPKKGMTCKCKVGENSYQGRTSLLAERIDLKKRKEQYDDLEPDDVPCLDELLKPMKYDKLKALLMQEGDEEDEDDDDEDLEDEDLDDEDEDSDDDEEDEDDEPKKKKKGKTKKSSKKKKSKSDDDEEEEDEDEDEEEEEDEDEDEEDEDSDEDESEVSVGDTVSFTYKGKKHTGKVKRKNGGLVHVKCKDRVDPYVIDVEELETDSDDDDEDEDEKPRKKKGKKDKKSSKKKKSRDDDDEDEDEDEDDDEDEDEDEDDDEDEDEDDDEDD